MNRTETERAITATTALSSELGLVVAEARVVCNSNKLGLRLLPCDSFARVAVSRQEAFRFEIEIAQRLSENGSDYEQPGIDPAATTYANALERLHAGMAQLDVIAPHFGDRVTEAEQLLRSNDRTPRLKETDRELLLETLRRHRRRNARLAAVPVAGGFAPVQCSLHVPVDLPVCSA
jgi:hypothetical protein